MLDHRLTAALIAAPLCCTGCDGDDGTGAEIDGVRVQVPAGWSATIERSGPQRELTLVDPSRTTFCQIVVVRDGRIFREDDVRAMVGSAKARYSVGVETADRIDTSFGALVGITSNEVDLAGSPIAAGAGRERRFGAWAGREHLRLLAALAATTDASADPDGDMRVCRDAIASMRLP